MSDPNDPSRADAAVDAERHFLLALGGFVLEVAGARFLTHEKLPLRRFNFVDVRAVSPERQAAFFERALDHYFQRALRPSFRVPVPVPDYLTRGLRALGFRPREEPTYLLDGPSGPAAPAGTAPACRVAAPGELGALAELWTGGRGAPELCSALDVAWHHPNPGERIEPVALFRGSEPISAAVRYTTERTCGLYLITTRPDARGQGAASSLVTESLRPSEGGPERLTYLWAESRRLESGLERLGFIARQEYTVFELPLDAQLALPPVGPAGPPRWRPPVRGAP